MEWHFTCFTRPQKGRQHAFWYSGSVAEVQLGGHHYEVIATGAITAWESSDGGEKVKWEDLAAEAHDDAGLERIVGATACSDKPYYWGEQNWFEVVDADTGEEVGPLAFEYDDAIENLHRAACRLNRFEAPDR